ncbi:MAG: histidine phosphatase family protein [Bacteroidaceae bacterium]|nr:histidine phosphatase family protein [Bacteroidaceae bacterium]MBQ3122157.1 histidine phosphatase family protein [Bacteroidaceae bacterium]
MKEKTTIYLTRHGQTEENAQGLFQGQTDGHLSILGREQARMLRPKIEKLQFDAILCSDLKRCRDTAAIALTGHIMADEIAYMPLLRERDLGNLTGTKIEGATLNESVESNQAVRERAIKFIEYAKKLYPGKRLLVFSHGFFCKTLQGVIEGKPYYDIPLMDNCEIRELNI